MTNNEEKKAEEKNEKRKRREAYYTERNGRGKTKRCLGFLTW